LHPWYAAQQRSGCPYAVDNGKEIIEIASEAHNESMMEVSCDCDQIEDGCALSRRRLTIGVPAENTDAPLGLVLSLADAFDIIRG
jgi:hypothetical protein